MLNFSKILEELGISTESINSIRLARGVVGKTSYVALGGFFVLAVVAWRLSSAEFLMIVTGATTLIFLVYFIGILLFASRNPGAALLEGAELITWQKQELAAKSLLEPPKVPAIPDPKGITLSSTDIDIEEPDK